MDVIDTIKYIDEIDVEHVLENKSITSSLALKRLVKPRLLFIGGDIEPHVWFYVGPRGDYVIVPKTYCSCKDFVINVMSRKKKRVCRHLIIQFIGSRKGLYRVVDIRDLETFSKIIHEILDINISPTLRKLLY